MRLPATDTVLAESLVQVRCAGEVRDNRLPATRSVDPNSFAPDIHRNRSARDIELVPIDELPRQIEAVRVRTIVAEGLAQTRSIGSGIRAQLRACRAVLLKTRPAVGVSRSSMSQSPIPDA
jgi:hypothetical protein